MRPGGHPRDTGRQRQTDNGGHRAAAQRAREQVAKYIKQFEKDKIILRYKTHVNWMRVRNNQVRALIEVKVTPERGVGFDAWRNPSTDIPRSLRCSCVGQLRSPGAGGGADPSAGIALRLGKAGHDQKRAVDGHPLSPEEVQGGRRHPGRPAESKRLPMSL